MSEGKKKTSILVRGFLIVMLAILISSFGFYASLLLCIGSTIALFASKAGKLGPKEGLQPRILKYLAVSAVVATISAYGGQKSREIDIAAEKNAEEELRQTKDLLDQKNYTSAIQKLEHLASTKTKTADEAKKILDYARNFTSEETVKKTFMDLSRDQFNMLVAGQLIPLNPNAAYNDELNKLLKSKIPAYKLAYLSAKNKEEKAAKNAEKAKKKIEQRIAKFGEPPIQSSWDGSYSAVSRFLEDRANDPDSIKIIGCTEVSFNESSGWIVGCDYRGKNAFGGLVKNSNWFVIRKGQVIQALPSDAFRVGH